MKALEFDPIKYELKIVKKNKPAPSTNEVVVKVCYSGICGTDLHIYEGHFPCKSTNFIPGHEISGIVDTTGTDVTHVKVGDKVAINPNCPCHVCSFCTTGRYNVCKTAGIYSSLGIFQDGGWADYCLLPASQVYRLPESITLKCAVLTEPISCVVHGLRRIGEIRIGERILIQGAGIIGNLWAAILHHKGHRNVTITEPSPIRRQIFNKIGTSFPCIDPEELQDFQADVVVDCTGSGEAIEKAANMLNPGGRLCLFGIAPPETTVRVSPFNIYEKEITISGVMINKFAIPEALGVIEAIGSTFLEYDRLGVKEFDPANFKEAFSQLKKGSISKAVFRFSQD